MSVTPANPAPLLSAITAALDLIRNQEGSTLPALQAPAAPLASLLDQCRALQDEARAGAQDPLRTIHHLACTGGTLISKCLAVQPNTRLLSEIAPLSPIGVDRLKPRFLPSDLVLHLKNGLRPVAQEEIVEVFLAGLAVLYRACRERGERLVLRDHAHSQFCFGATIPTYPTLDRMVAPLGPVLSVVTVRHPLDSYLSLLNNRWEHHIPKGIDEYTRRYHAFLDAHSGMPVYRYEDIVADPAGRLSQICHALALPWNSEAINLFQIAHISGDSGRSSGVISSRSRRPVPAPLVAEAQASEAFRTLCQRLGYDWSGVQAG